MTNFETKLLILQSNEIKLRKISWIWCKIWVLLPKVNFLKKYCSKPKQTLSKTI